jgi:myo-inositol-1(or 4)-monophosphatase
MLLKTWDPKVIVDILRRCSDVALTHFNKTRLELKEDRSIVTNADREIEEILRGYFDSPENGIYMIGEETQADLSAGYLTDALHYTSWIVDPIDGTASYANGLNTWGISIAFAEGGVIREGAICLPIEEKLLITNRGRLLYSDRSDSSGHFLWENPVDYRRNHLPLDESRMISLCQAVSKIGGFNGTNPVYTCGSSVYSLFKVITGNFAAYVTTVKLWDIAAGLPMLEILDLRKVLFHNGTLSMDINSRLYNTDNRTLDAWALKDFVIFARDDETVGFLKERIVLPEAK